MTATQTQRATDELFSDYTSARHKYAIADGSGDVDACMAFMDDAHAVEDKLESRGVSREKLRDFWSNFAEAHGLDH